jgi:hypothetical protein
MTPIPQSKLEEVLLPIFEQRIVETSMQEQADARYSMERYAVMYSGQTAAAYVDSLESPKCCLALFQTRRMFHPAPMCAVLLLWVHPDHRGTTESVRMVAEMFKTIDAYAAVNKCAFITGSSWVYLGSEDMDALWSRHGYDLQEKVFIKELE